MQITKYALSAFPWTVQCMMRRLELCSIETLRSRERPTQRPPRGEGRPQAGLDCPRERFPLRLAVTNADPHLGVSCEPVTVIRGENQPFRLSPMRRCPWHVPTGPGDSECRSLRGHFGRESYGITIAIVTLSTGLPVNAVTLCPL